jgi:RNA polymerase sigma factor (sigma-70 family)
MGTDWNCKHRIGRTQSRIRFTAENTENAKIGRFFTDVADGERSARSSAIFPRGQAIFNAPNHDEFLSGFGPAGCYSASMTTDGELLRQYAEENSDQAFTQLVERHVKLVYSAALRQVNGDEHLARDVAQSVFTDLARKATALARRESLTGWLYSGTHFAAAKVVRREQRRHTREQEAHAMQELLQDPPADANWERLRPVLDQAMHELKEADRVVILMRYFENHSFADIGQKLGLSEDAARKRTGRTLEKLRESLTKRGVSTGAALGTVLSAHAIQVAPAGLAATLASTSLAGATMSTTTVISALKTMSIPKLQAGLIGAIAAACVVVPMVMERQAQAAFQQKNDAWREGNDQIARLSAENERLSERLKATNNPSALDDANLHELLKLRGEIAPLRERLQELAQVRNNQSASGTMTLADRQKLWRGRLAQLKAWADENPREKIPEMKYLDNYQWVTSLGTSTLEKQEDYERAMAVVRVNAEWSVISELASAWRAYAKANDGKTPGNITDLVAYLKEPIDDGILQNYEFVSKSSLAASPPEIGDWVITTKAPVNETYDHRPFSGFTLGQSLGPNVTNLWNTAQNQ